jgi:hypothetical protein
LVLTLWGSLAQGEDFSRSKSGLEVSSFRDGNSITQGMMIGGRSVRYFPGTRVNLGVQFDAGSSHGQALDHDNLAYGGLTMGYDGTFNQIFVYDFSMLVGYGFGRVDSLGISGHSMTVLPSVGAGVKMVEGYRATFFVGYLYMPSASGFSNFTFGVRLEQKEENYSNASPY